MIAIILTALLSCGIPPFPPIPPIGTTHCEKVCVCDQRGDNCHWEFVCE